MQLPRFALIIHAVPIEHTIGSVAVLLDFDQQISGAYSVKASRRKENGVARFDADFVNVIGCRSAPECDFELISRDRLTKSKHKLGAWIGRCDVPEFIFWFTA